MPLDGRRLREFGKLDVLRQCRMQGDLGEAANRVGAVLTGRLYRDIIVRVHVDGSVRAGRRRRSGIHHASSALAAALAAAALAAAAESLSAIKSAHAFAAAAASFAAAEALWWRHRRPLPARRGRSGRARALRGGVDRHLLKEAGHLLRLRRQIRRRRVRHVDAVMEGGRPVAPVRHPPRTLGDVAVGDDLQAGHKLLERHVDAL